MTNNPVQKPKLLYLNYHSMPEIMKYHDKLSRFYCCFEYLHFLSDKYITTVIDHIGTASTFYDREINYIVKKKKKNIKWHIPFKLHKDIISLNPDIIYVQSLLQMYFLIFLVPFLKKTTKILVHHHAEKPPSFIKSLLLKCGDNFVDQYFFTSKEMANEWVGKKIISSKDKITEMVEGSTSFLYDTTITRKTNSFLWVGRLDKNKDPITIIKAFKNHLNICPEAKLTMVFSADTLLKEITLLINEDALAKKQVILKGELPHKEMERLYNKHVFFILGSHYEGGSFALIEAMACGCIPIVSNIPANKSMTNNGACGFLFSVGNSKDLERCLTLATTINKEEYRNKSLKVFEEKLSYQAIANTLHKTITNL